MTSFARPTRSVLIDRDLGDANARLPGADSRVRRNYLNGIMVSHAGGMDAAYGQLSTIADQVMPDSADLPHLIRWASIWGVDQKTATAAGGAASSAGSVDGMPLPAGAVLQRGDGVQFTTDSDATVAGGVANVTVTASSPGQAANTDAGVQLQLVSPVDGIGSTFIVGEDGLSGGNDAESPEELLADLLQRIQNPPQGGALADYEAWALSVPGVTRVWVLPGWNGAGSVGVTFVCDGRDDIIPTDDDVAAVQAYIDGVRPVTASVVVFAPIPDPKAFTISVTPSTGDVQAAVAAELADLFFREQEPGGTILRSHYDQAISLAQGESDHSVAVPDGAITSAPGHLPMLGDITWA